MTVPINRVINRLAEYPIEDVLKLREAIEDYLGTQHLPARQNAEMRKLDGREGYRLGLDASFAQCEVFIANVEVAETLSRVADVVLSTESLPSDFQSIQLRNFYTAYGIHENMEKKILDVLYHLKTAMGDAEPYARLSGGYKIQRDDSERVINIAMKFIDGIHALTRDINPDGGSSLRDAVIEFGSPVVRDIRDRMAVNAKKLGKGAQQEEWKLELKDRWMQIEADHPHGIKPGEVRHKILKSIANWINGAWIKPPPDEISDAESKMFDSLMTQKAKKDAATYRKWLLD